MFVPRPFEKRLTEVYVYPEICKYQDALRDPRAYMTFLNGEPPRSGFMFYVHVPFCETLCSFCNYHKVAMRKDAYDERKQLFDRYVREIESYARGGYLADRPVRAVQFGGGTPSAVEPEFLVRVLDAIRANFTCRFEMVSMEGNVSSLQDRARLRQLRDAGVQRISFGVQTLNERIRAKLNITARPADIFAAVGAIDAIGFEDYSHDLMFNLPGQTLDDVRRDFEIADREIRPTYIDCYNLNVMPNTLFDASLRRNGGATDAPSDAKEIAMLRELMALATARGYRAVMSNIVSKRRDRCVLTLDMQLNGSDAVGIGPSARGYLAGHGYRNVPDIGQYMSRVDEFGFSALMGNVATAQELDERRLVMFGNFGFVRKADVRDLTRWRAQIDFLVNEGYATEDGEYLRLTPEGMLWPGNVSELFFGPDQRGRRSRAMLNALRHKENPYNQDRMGVSAKLYRRPASAGARAGGVH